MSATFDALAPAYVRLFGDQPKPGDAAAVLADLKGFCASRDPFVPGGLDETAYYCGMLRVWLRIERALARGRAEPPPDDSGKDSPLGDVRGVEMAPGPLGAEGE